ncbi:hypothetical protein F4809DRAFT_456705 [Biscogniauxia mediterranea]|nr:hypothetical protein F4809DRAFT_456705 [Biscogniauxia mediterranea]
MKGEESLLLLRLVTSIILTPGTGHTQLSMLGIRTNKLNISQKILLSHCLSFIYHLFFLISKRH